MANEHYMLSAVRMCCRGTKQFAVHSVRAYLEKRIAMKVFRGLDRRLSAR